MQLFIKRFLFFGGLLSSGYVILWGGIIFSQKLQVTHCDINVDTQALIIGDSHTMWAINDSDINGIQNISLNAEGYIFSYLKLINILKNNPAISKVYLGVSYHNFSIYYDDYIYGGKSTAFFYRYLGIIGCDDFLWLLTQEFSNNIELLKHTLTKSLVTLIRQECSLYSNFPEVKMTNQYNYASMHRRISEQFYKNKKELPFSELNILYFKNILGLCKEKGIEVTFISTPLHETYKKMIPINYIELYYTLVTESGITTYNFSDLSLPDSCFLPDADHVNYYGALLTTQYFKAYYEKTNNRP